MIINNPYLKKDKPLITLVSTPIGNLEDITIRALNYLKSCDIIACEDTRVTMKLLKHYNIESKPLVSLYAQTERKNCIALIEKVKKDNLKLAYCSDAGMPCISDPGNILVSEAYKAGVSVSIIPGPSASLSALAISGLNSADFAFYGFLPTKSGAIKEMLNKIKDDSKTAIFYESPKRISKTISYMKEIYGKDRKAAIVREITKLYEESLIGTLEELEKIEEIKGECVILVEGVLEKKQISEAELIELIREELKNGSSVKDLSKKIAEQENIKKSDVYKLALSLIN